MHSVSVDDFAEYTIGIDWVGHVGFKSIKKKKLSDMIIPNGIFFGNCKVFAVFFLFAIKNELE